MLSKKILLLYAAMCAISINCQQPPKLKNFGATCFQNATLQVLYNMQPITDFLVTHVNSYPENTISHIYTRLVTQIRCQLPESENHYYLLKEFANYGYALVLDCTSAEGCQYLMQCREEDASDFFGRLLDSLITTPSNEDKENIRQPIDIAKLIKEHPLGKLTSIDLLSIITCPDIPYESRKTEIANKLDVAVKVHGKVLPTLKDCLDNFIAPAPFQYTPEGFKREANCFQQFLLGNTPDYINVSLKRTVFHEREYWQAVKTAPPSSQPNPDAFREKINDPVNIPPEFDFGPYMTNTVKQHLQTNYQLIGAIHHSGQARAGHYIAFVKNNNQWYSCDDTNIKQTTWSAIQNQIDKSYVLVYQNQNMIMEPPIQLNCLAQALENLQFALDKLQKTLSI